MTLGERAVEEFRRSLNGGSDGKAARGYALRLAAGLVRKGEGEQAREALRAVLPGIDGCGELKRLEDELQAMLGARFSLEVRKFQLFCLGHSKTGTNSISEIFRNHRIEHDFEREASEKAIADHAAGKISRRELRAFIRARDERGRLEVDSSTLHQGWLKLLADEFPLAKFIFTIRDCYSWLDSSLNQLLAKRLVSRVDDTLDDLVRDWVEVNTKALKELPRERSLVLRTHELSARLSDIASLAGVPRETLVRERSHENQARQRFDVLRKLERAALRKRVEQPCAALMKKHFPEFTLAAFLSV